jgi:hypothetical protein
MMMPHTPPAVTPSLVLRQNWETLAWLASQWSKSPDVDACPHTIFIRTLVFKRKLPNLVPLGFEAQTRKLSWWFCGPSHQTTAANFEAQTRKPEWVVLRPKHKNHSHRFWSQTGRNHRPWFWGWTRKSVLLDSLCTMDTAHIITQPLDRLATKYLTCA